MRASLQGKAEPRPGKGRLGLLRKGASPMFHLAVKFHGYCKVGARQNLILSRRGRNERSYPLRPGRDLDGIRAGPEPWEGVHK